MNTTLKPPTTKLVVVCAHCQQEFGTTPPPHASHGICRRHALEFLAGSGLSKEKVDRAIARLGVPAPDMREELVLQ